MPSVWLSWKRQAREHELTIPKRRLGRLHRIRALEEDLARTTVEGAVAAVRLAETGIERALAQEKAARGRRNAALLETGPSAALDPERWRQAESEAQIHRVLAIRHARSLPALEKEAAALREEYLERRRERQKLEKLLTKAAEEERIANERRSAAAMEGLLQGRRWHESHERENTCGSTEISSR